MNKVYLVINSWSCESSGNIDMQKISVFKDYSSAKKEFEEIKEKIQSFNLGYDYIENEKDFYCESIDGEYLYNHELVYIEEKEIN